MKCAKSQCLPTRGCQNVGSHLYLTTSADNQVAATILLNLILALGTGLSVCVEPVCCLTVITAFPLPLLPPDKDRDTLNAHQVGTKCALCCLHSMQMSKASQLSEL